MDTADQNRLLPCLLLAGGFGTRIAEVSGNDPKSMLRVGGRPFLEYLVLQLRAQGFGDLILCTGYRGEVLEAYFADGARWGVSIRYSREREPLGTGGALKLAAQVTSAEHLVALNGDSILDADLGALVAMHLDRRARATIALAHAPDASRFGRVEYDDCGRVTRFIEKGSRGPGWINGGIYVLDRTILEGMSEGKVSLEQEVFPQILDGGGLFAKAFSGFFVDMGIPSDFQLLAGDPQRLSKWSAVATPTPKEFQC